VGRRPDGALEEDILRVLWVADGPLSVSEIRDLLPTELAHTSVATVVTRLHAKGMVRRLGKERQYEYVAVLGEAQLAARRMSDALASASDTSQVLAGFVGSLPPRDLKILRHMLSDGDAR
jgi:predicted transcriptional regulator